MNANPENPAPLPERHFHPVRWLAAVLLLSVAGAVAFLVAVGGREGAILWYVRHFLREEAAPTQPVVWQTVPATTAPDGKTRPPNIILIVADDLGANDLTLRGAGVAGELVPTPNINRIASEGVEFVNGYSGNATCSPSRAALLTGRYPTRVGFEFTPVPVPFSRVVGGHRNAEAAQRPIFHAERLPGSPDYDQMGLPPGEITLATLLRGHGYRTLHIGKWHLGEAARFSPNAHGFDESLGFAAGASMFLAEDDSRVVNAKLAFDPIDRFLWAAHPFHLRFNGGTAFRPPRYLTDYLTDEALAAIQANRSRPFFLYLAYNTPHTPLQAAREDYEALAGIPDHTRRVYGAMIRSLDRNVGRVLDALDRFGLAENTLVVFTSDNGAPHSNGLAQLNAPYRGWKATFFEGGIHVPYFMRWPGRIPEGTRVPAPATHFDVFATAAAAAGVPIPRDRVIDGIDLLPAAVEGATVPARDLFWRSGNYLAIRSGDWKLQRSVNPDRTWLFNLLTDPTEQHNLAERLPQQRDALVSRLRAFDQAQAKPLWPSLLEAPVPVDRTLNSPAVPAEDYVYWSN